MCGIVGGGLVTSGMISVCVGLLAVGCGVVALVVALVRLRLPSGKCSADVQEVVSDGVDLNFGGAIDKCADKLTISASAT